MTVHVVLPVDAKIRAAAAGVNVDTNVVAKRRSRVYGVFK
jgi:hypothetical protein